MSPPKWDVILLMFNNDKAVALNMGGSDSDTKGKPQGMKALREIINGEKLAAIPQKNILQWVKHKEET